MTAWSVLIGNSTLPASAIAWEHLNNQAGEGGGTIENTFYEESLVTLESDFYVILEPALPDLRATLESGLYVLLEEEDATNLTKDLFVEL